MGKSKRVLSIVLALMLIMAAAIGYPSEVEAAQKNGCYMFASMVKCKISGNNIVVKKGSSVYVSYGKKEFQPYSVAKKAGKNYKFKLSNKIYYFDREYPCKTVHKFGVSFDMSHGRYMSRAKFKKKIKNTPVFMSCYIIIKKGKVVAFGTSA